MIDKLSKDIKSEFPKIKGFSTRNLKYMQKFAKYYPQEIIVLFANIWHKSINNEFVQLPTAQIENTSAEFMQQPNAQLEDDFLKSPISKLTWTHNMAIMDKLSSYNEIFWYMANTIEHGNSSNILKMQIDAGLFNRQVNKKTVSNFKVTLPPAQSDFANYLMKDPYIFDFVQAKEKADERDIEEQLTTHISKFLLELGQGFAFIGRQYHLKIGESDNYIDLLFYHTKLHAYVVVELKARKFKPGDPAQLNFYINVINDKLKTDADNDTIGILLCKGKSEVLAEYALKGYNNPISVSDYELSTALPEKLKSTLPQIEDLENELNQIDKRNNS